MANLSYTIGTLNPHSHLYEVELLVEGISSETLDFVLPVWTPGSYMVREYSRHVQEFAAFAGDTALTWRKLAKQTWQVTTEGASTLRISYKVYAYDLTVRTSHLDGSHGFFNGATVFMYLPERQNEAITLNVVVPPNWHVSTGLEPIGELQQPEQRIYSFSAADYDELVDCPVECGTHRILSFEVDNKPHTIAIWGHGNEDDARLLADTKRIVETQSAMFGGLPYEHYTFILHLSDSRGGLEHRNSVTNLLDRWCFGTARGYESFLALQSHEFFHVWNVKRIRAEPLGPFDYSQENYTRLLWAMEGVTSYYDKLLLVRSGLMTPSRFLETLASSILVLQSQPGRQIQSLETSSFDAWIKYYRPDENSANTSISYYLKGALVTLLLDMEILARTNGARSMDDVLRYLFETYPITGPGIPEEGAYRAAVEHIAGGDFSDFFQRYIVGTDELDYSHYLDLAGVELRWSYQRPRGDGSAPAWLGLNLRRDGGKLKVSSVRSDSPAYSAGIYANDEIVAFNNWRVDDQSFTERLSECKPGDEVTIALFRRDELFLVPVVVAESPYDQLQLLPKADASELQKQIFQKWLRTQP
jgi:predicted metalloprotease with PDZ domain